MPDTNLSVSHQHLKPLQQSLLGQKVASLILILPCLFGILITQGRKTSTLSFRKGKDVQKWEKCYYLRSILLRIRTPHVKNELGTQLHTLQCWFWLLSFSFPLLITKILQPLCQQEIKQVILFCTSPTSHSQSCPLFTGFCINTEAWVSKKSKTFLLEIACLFSRNTFRTPSWSTNIIQNFTYSLKKIHLFSQHLESTEVTNF